jgi:hypothetical protein
VEEVPVPPGFLDNIKQVRAPIIYAIVFISGWILDSSPDETEASVNIPWELSIRL